MHNKFIGACVLLLAVLTAALPLHAQDAVGGMGGYDSFDVNAGEMEADMTGMPRLLTGGSNIVLRSDDPARKPLPISARTIRFDYNEGEETPARIYLEGKVVVTHPDGKVRSDKAEWDLAEGILKFTGNPMMSTSRAEEIAANEVVLNFKTDRIKLYGAKIKNMTFGGGLGGPSNPALLAESDIQDWPTFLKTMRSQIDADGATPAKRVLAVLDDEARTQMAGATPEQLLENKKQVLKQLNKAILSPKLYDASAWAKATLDASTQALLAQDVLEGPDQSRLNRGLIEAAFPGAIAKQGS